jgi:hypothetical protein
VPRGVAACALPSGPMPDTSDSIPALPLDAQSILELAARSMFQLFSSVSQGMFLVDRTCRIVWVNEGYQRFLPDLGFLVGGPVPGPHGGRGHSQHPDAPCAGNRASLC